MSPNEIWNYDLLFENKSLSLPLGQRSFGNIYPFEFKKWIKVIEKQFKLIFILFANDDDDNQNRIQTSLNIVIK